MQQYNSALKTLNFIYNIHLPYKYIADVCVYITSINNLN